MSNLTDFVHLEIPGFMPVCVVEAGRIDWGVVRMSDRVVVQTGLDSEQEALERAGTLSIRLQVEGIAEACVERAARNAVAAFESVPHTAGYGKRELELSLHDDIMHCLTTKLHGWMHKTFKDIEEMRNARKKKSMQENVESVRNVNEKLTELNEVAEAKAQEKEESDGRS